MTLNKENSQLDDTKIIQFKHRAAADSVQKIHTVALQGSINELQRAGCAGPAEQTGWEYLTDFKYSRTDNPVSWIFINFIRRNRGLYRIAKSLLSIKRYGLKTISKFFHGNSRKHISLLRKELKLTKHERIAQEKTEFPKQIRISLKVSLCNTPLQLF